MRLFIRSLSTGVACQVLGPTTVVDWAITSNTHRPTTMTQTVKSFRINSAIDNLFFKILASSTSTDLIHFLTGRFLDTERFFLVTRLCGEVPGITKSSGTDMLL